MEYSKLGRTDLHVSKLCLGSMTWGQQNSEQEAHSQIDCARASGINFIDTAEMYPVPPKAETQGLTEKYIGSWLKHSGARAEVIIASKVAGPAAWLPHLRGGPRLNADHIERALEASLQRMQTDYIDLYQVHWPARTTNYFGQLGYNHVEEASVEEELEQTLLSIDKLIRQGKIRQWGLSNETAWGLMKAISLSDKLGMLRPLTIQNPYSLLNRSFDVGLAECSHRESVGLLAYSPLAFGVLTGKYMDGARPEGARITLFDRFSRYTHERAERAVADYHKLAQHHGMSLTQLALAFVNSRSFLASNIIGATNIEQLEENIASIDVQLDDELQVGLERLHQVHTIPCP
jgi:aryl-alcohol dehydrogenase-like predicted oxidoreductase